MEDRQISLTRERKGRRIVCEVKIPFTCSTGSYVELVTEGVCNSIRLLNKEMNENSLK